MASCAAEKRVRNERAADFRAGVLMAIMWDEIGRPDKLLAKIGQSEGRGARHIVDTRHKPRRSHSEEWGCKLLREGKGAGGQ